MEDQEKTGLNVKVKVKAIIRNEEMVAAFTRSLCIRCLSNDGLRILSEILDSTYVTVFYNTLQEICKIRIPEIFTDISKTDSFEKTYRDDLPHLDVQLISGDELTTLKNRKDGHHCISNVKGDCAICGVKVPQIVDLTSYRNEKNRG